MSTVILSPNNFYLDSRQVLSPSSLYQHHIMFLQSVSHTRNVCSQFFPIAQSDSAALTLSWIWFLGLANHDLQYNPLHLGITVKDTLLFGFGLQRSLSNNLVYSSEVWWAGMNLGDGQGECPLLNPLYDACGNDWSSWKHCEQIVLLCAFISSRKNITISVNHEAQISPNVVRGIAIVSLVNQFKFIKLRDFRLLYTSHVLYSTYKIKLEPTTKCKLRPPWVLSLQY